MPRADARHGTSTQQSAGRLSISCPPAYVLGTLPLKRNDSPVSQALTMLAPYSAKCSEDSVTKYPKCRRTS